MPQRRLRELPRGCDHGSPTGCDKCHSAIDNWSKTADCVSCHNTANPHPNEDASHTANPASETVTISGETFGPVECGDCHELPLLTSIHTGACTTCHPTPKDTVAGTWDKSCVQGGCHTAGSDAPMHASIDASHAPVAGQTCYASSCHPAAGTDSLAETHRNASAELGGQVRTSCQVCHWNGTPASRECASCHADKVDGQHGYSAAAHAADTAGAAMVGTWTMALLPDQMAAGQQLHPPLSYDHGCATCHATDLKTEHEKASSAPVNASACEDCHPTARDSLKPAAWNKGCSQSGTTGDGCHTVAGQEQHASTATLAKHSVAASYTVEPGGCSAAPGAVEGSYQRRTCHTTDIIQEHNRKIAGVGPGNVQMIAREISVTCDECHASSRVPCARRPMGRHLQRVS